MDNLIELLNTNQALVDALLIIVGAILAKLGIDVKVANDRIKEVSAKIDSLQGNLDK